MDCPASVPADTMQLRSVNELQRLYTNTTRHTEQEIKENQYFFSLKTSFYRAAFLQGSLSHKRNVCLSVSPSVKRVNCDKTKETYTHILILQDRCI